MSKYNSMYEFMANYLTESDIYAAKAIAKISMTIYKYRKDNNLSQKQFAQLMNVTQSMVSKWESGEYNFTVENIAKISESLNLNFDILFTPKNEYSYSNKANSYSYSKSKVSFEIVSNNAA